MPRDNRPVSNFVKALGDTPVNRLWDFLVTSRGLFDYSMTDICEATGIAWNTLKDVFPEFVRESIVKKTRVIGRATMYKLDETHPKAVFMIGIHNAVSMVFVHGGRFCLKFKITKCEEHDHTQPVELDISRQSLEPVKLR